MRNYIPLLPTEKIITEDGNLTPEWHNFFDTLLQNLRQTVGPEGILNPSNSQANVDLIQPEALPGIVVFNSSVVNGGTTDAPNGQLQLRLADGTFRNIVNS